MKKVIFILTLLSISFNLIGQSAWAAGTGKAYIKLSEWWISSDQHFSSNGEKDPNTTLGLYNTNLYAEVGITKKITLTVNVPVYSKAVINNLISETTGEVITPGDELSSIGDTDVAISYMITPSASPIVVSASVIAGIPSGKKIGGALGNLQTGDGEFNQMFRVDVGASVALSNANVYGALNGTYNNRSDGFSDELRMGLEGGIGFGKNPFWIIAKLQYLGSLDNGVDGLLPTTASLFSNDIKYTSITAEIAKYISGKLGFSAGMTHYLSGEIVLSDPAFNVGVFLDLKK